MKEPARPEKNQPYRIRISLWSTALVFQSKHRIALHVTSSNWPRFERHSNTWNPAPSYEQAVTANNRVYKDKERPSALVLPVR
ncbi:MAG TPA: CocE/NonD family hydrolase C-terminal non-catalytic domain-containing protein [Candidatus Solibacter sp.]|nr:CocE/NonD family hydrolase C-terminal non-catalytic domain-containing protein [Candidatus Solibacter sp.]